MIIWIASYPRSGNTFLRVVLKSAFGLETYSIYDDKSDIGKDAATSEVVGHKMLPDNFDLDEARKSDQLYLIKTHDYISNNDDKAIYLVRDGRQCSLSYMKYICSFHDEGCSILDVLYGNVPFGSWGGHLENWKPNKRENTLLLKFEDFTAAPQSFLGQISQFIGIRKRRNEIPGFKELNQINPIFFRQGKFDTWKEYFTDENILIFWLMNFGQMRQYYPDEIYPEKFDSIALSDTLQKRFTEQANYFRETLADQRKRSVTVARRQALRIKKLEKILFAAEQLFKESALRNPIAKYQAYKGLLEQHTKNFS